MVGWARGGPAKVAVLSGAMFGSVSGSSVANVVASGSVTIPMMRRVGYDRATAGAIEATSSTGGQLTPPVLGAAAFIMAEATGIKYAEIAAAAIIPCLLFYIACYAHCDLHAAKHGLRGIPRSELPPLRPLLARLYMIAPIAVLIWAFVSGYSAFLAAGIGMLLCVAVSWLNGLRPGAGGGLGWRGNDGVMGGRAIIEALEAGARDCVQLVAVCAAAGVIVGVIALTGKGGGKIGEMLADLAEKREGPLTEGRRNQELARFSRAPVVIGVVSSPKENPKIPQWEMFLSGAAAAMNLLLGATAMGFGANWITNWYSDVPEGRAILGLAPQERVIGFVHIGTYSGQTTDRPRPDPHALYTDYSGPWQG